MRNEIRNAETLLQQTVYAQGLFWKLHVWLTCILITSCFGHVRGTRSTDCQAANNGDSGNVMRGAAVTYVFGTRVRTNGGRVTVVGRRCLLSCDPLKCAYGCRRCRSCNTVLNLILPSIFAAPITNLCRSLTSCVVSLVNCGRSASPASVVHYYRTTPLGPRLEVIGMEATV